MKAIRFYSFVCLSVMIYSCSSNKVLEYFIPNDETNLLIQKEINNLKGLKKEIILVLDKDNSNNILTLIPITDKFIQKFNLRRTNRIIVINNSKYNVVFGFDYELGIKKEIVNEDGIEIIKYNRKVYINEYAIKLYFDKKWNFIKKE
jgi:hypothetical protein